MTNKWRKEEESMKGKKKRRGREKDGNEEGTERIGK